MAPIGGVRSGIISAARDAIPDIVTEDWERSNPLDDYTDGGGKSAMSQDTGQVWEGTSALLNQSTGGFSDPVYSVDGTGLTGRTPAKGDSFGSFHYVSDTANHETQDLFGIQDGSSFYFARLAAKNSEFILQSPDGGRLASDTFAPRSGWYYLIVRWHDADTSQSEDTIEIELYEMEKGTDTVSNLGTLAASASVVDTEFATETGYGVAGNHDSSSIEAYHDYAGIRGDADA